MPTALLEILNHSVLSVFNELNLSSEAWFQRSRLLTVGRRNYSRYIADSFGQFPLFGTTRFASVDEAYVKVNITHDMERERYKSVGDITAALRRQSRGEPLRLAEALTPIEAIENSSSHFALLGHAGSGKTTAFRHVAIEVAKGHAVRGRRRLPVYFAVRDMAPESQGITNFAVQFLDRLGIQEANRVLVSLLTKGTLVLLLDGIDETEEEHQKQLVRDLDDLRSRYPETIICVSGRPHSLSIGLAGFTKWETLPLDFEERLAFVNKWFQSVNPTKGRRLLEQSRARPELLDLGSSPLLLSIVCAVYDHDLDLPSDPDELYAQAVDGLLGRWDAFRNIARRTVLSAISIRRRLTVLSWVAASLFEQQKLVFSFRDLEDLRCLERALQAVRAEPIDAQQFLKTMSNDFGLLVERAPGLYSFSHLTLHEYLVALFVVENRREISFLAAHKTHQMYLEIFRLVAKMLPRAVDFMTSLTTRARLESLDDHEAIYEIALLRTTWLTRPMMPKPVALQLMRHLADKIGALALRCSATFHLDGNSLVCEVSQGRDKLEMLIDILNASGFSYNELRFKGMRELRARVPIMKATVARCDSTIHENDAHGKTPSEPRRSELAKRLGRVLEDLARAESRKGTVEEVLADLKRAGRVQHLRKLKKEYSELQSKIETLMAAREELEVELRTLGDS